MNPIYRLAALSLLLCGPAGAQGTPTIEGRWRAAVSHAEIAIAPCGAAFCGRIVTSDGIKENPALADANNKDPKLRARPRKGLVMLQGFVGGPHEWTGGRVYNPEDGETYAGSLALRDANTLDLTGCAYKILCKTQTWHRLP